jgi:hypothetical protein
MSDTEAEARKCAVCGKKMRIDNSGTTHWKCRKGSITESATSKPRKSGLKAATSEDWLENFDVVATALGIDGQALLSDFAKAWLERVRTAANPSPSADDED